MQSIHLESRPRTHPPTDNQQPRSSKQAEDTPRKARWVVRRPTRISIFVTAGHAAIMKNNSIELMWELFEWKGLLKINIVGRPCSAGELAEWSEKVERSKSISYGLETSTDATSMIAPTTCNKFMRRRQTWKVPFDGQSPMSRLRKCFNVVRLSDHRGILLRTPRRVYFAPS